MVNILEVRSLERRKVTATASKRKSTEKGFLMCECSFLASLHVLFFYTFSSNGYKMLIIARNRVFHFHGALKIACSMSSLTGPHHSTQLCNQHLLSRGGSSHPHASTLATGPIYSQIREMSALSPHAQTSTSSQTPRHSLISDKEQAGRAPVHNLRQRMNGRLCLETFHSSPGKVE
ncbi:hypothetical protein BJ165DRAFT_649585 [Panaeolus papilionaceus]|nr:hypothetical protein BJ165DRAFT_649585 [Panaeolus papilionaceus]